MPARTLTAAVLLIACLGAPAAAQDDAPDLGRNAALRYWQVFAALPQLTEDQQSLVRDLAAVDPADPQVAALVESAASAVTQLRGAAAIGPCDWGVDQSEGFSALLPHLGKARELTWLVCLTAHTQFAAGEADAAVANLRALAKLCRDVGQPPLLICQLVQIAMQKSTLDCVALNAHRMTPAQRAALAADLDGLMPAPMLADGLRTEKAFAVDWIRGLLAKPDGLRQLQQMLGGAPIPDAPAPRPGDNPVGDRTAEAVRTVFLRQVDLLEADYDALIAAALKDPHDMADTQDRVIEGAKAKGHILSGLVLPAVTAAGHAFRAYETRLHMTRAALLYLDGGADAFNAVKQPGTDKPFELKRNATSVTLTADLTERDNAPISLTVRTIRESRE